MKATAMLSGNVLAHASGALAPRERASSTCLFVHGSVLVAHWRPTLARFADVPQRLAAQPGPLVFLIQLIDPYLHLFIDHNEVLITQQPEQQQHEQNTDTTVYRTSIRFDPCNALLVSR